MSESAKTADLGSESNNKTTPATNGVQADKIAKKTSPSKIPTYLFRIVSILVILALLGVIFYLNKPKNWFGNLVKSPEPIPSPLPIRPLPSGKQIYNYSSTNVPGPVPYQVVVDPLTPNVGDLQTVIVKIRYDSPVTSANVNLYTDNGIANFPLELTEGTTTDGTWKGSWKMPEKYDYTYYLEFDIKSEKDNYNKGLRFR